MLALPFPFSLMNCARESAPLGGPKDTIAPYAVLEKPVNNSQNINPQKIVIKFNEYIELENVDDNCMISPIMEERPEITVKKKKMTIDLSSQNLQSNTTYSFNFSNAIKDLTENNVTEQYTYAFSTGTGIDTMKIAGKILTAKDGKIPEHAYVLLYDNLSDTAFKTQKPRYVTQVSKKGEFSFSNIEAKEYRIYALEDSDKDFTFNQVSEKIAFLDTIFKPTAERYIDTLWFMHNDTIRFEDYEDSIQITQVKDSFNLVGKTRWSDQDVKLTLFENEVWNQEIISSKRISKYQFSIKFAAKDLLPEEIRNLWYGSYDAEKVGNDSLILWFKDTTLQNSDSAQFIFKYHKNKASDELISDTLAIETKKDIPERLTITTSIDKDAKVFSGDSIELTLSRPLTSSELSDIVLYKSCDTTKGNCENLLEYSDYRFRPKYHYMNQSILRHKEATDRFALYFSKPIQPENVTVTLDGLPNLTDWYFCEVDEKSNALIYWIKPETDALRLKNQAITVKFNDENGNVIEKNFNTKKDIPVQKMYKTPYSNKKLIVQMNDNQKKAFKAHEPIRIYCNNPILSITDSLFSMIDVEDSLEQSIITKIVPLQKSSRIIEIYHSAKESENYTLTIHRNAIIDTFGSPNREFIADIQCENSNDNFVQTMPYSIVPIDGKARSFAITANWEANTSYNLLIPDSTFKDIFGDANDSTMVRFQCPKSENFGNLLVKNTQGFPSDNLVFVLEQTDSKEIQTYTGKKKSDGIHFENLPATNYTLYCFVDENRNGIWDSGCIELKRQPEKIYFFKEAVNVKAEWDNSIYWEEFK